MHERLARARLYLCTDARRERGDLAQFADAALAGGVDIIQLRDKGSPGEQRFGPLEARDELAACEVLADAARRHGALFAVNDRADIAHAAGADVLHLGQGDLPVEVAREIVGPATLIGLSSHDSTQAAMAAGAADYFCVGPCWPTPTKPGRAAPGLQLVGRLANHHCARPRQTVVRDRRHRDAKAARGARRRGPPDRGGAGDHRGRGPTGRGPTAQLCACSSELIRRLSNDGA